jgi:hypothetical protein
VCLKKKGTAREARGAATLDSRSLDSAEDRAWSGRASGFSSLYSGRRYLHVWGQAGHRNRFGSSGDSIGSFFFYMEDLSITY